MKDPKNKTELLEMIIQERIALDSLLEEMEEDHKTQPILDGGWSVVDMLAHISAWEAIMIEWLGIIQGEGKLDQAPYGMDDARVDQINLDIYQENRDKSAAQIQNEYAASYQQALEVLQNLPEEIMFERKYLIWGEELPVWLVIGANTCGHYAEHREQLEKL